MVGLRGDQKPSLPSSLLPWGECVSCSSVPPGMRVHVRACMRVFSVTLSQSHEVRWDEVWFLIPGRVDSCKTSDKRHSETVKYTSRTHYLFFSHFFTLRLWSSAGRWTSNLQLGTALFQHTCNVGGFSLKWKYGSYKKGPMWRPSTFSNLIMTYLPTPLSCTHTYLRVHNGVSIYSDPNRQW